MKLSIIVPVYGVAPYLRKCVDSLLNQDIPSSEYEIILVDDGSTDGSGAICDELAGKPTSGSSLKGREDGTHDSFARVWGAHTADSTQYNLLKENAQENRINPTEAESVLWSLLKANNIGLHFRRQHIILDYIVDFICLEKGLVIELDGGYHNVPEQVEHDKQRTSHLKQLGYTELRFTNEELLTSPDAVIARIKSVASSLPSLQGRGGERPLIRVIHRKNGGLSAARNSGIEIAQGEYLMFVDSDDYIEPNVLGSLVAKMDADKLDILRFNFQNVNEYYEVFTPYKSAKPYMDYRDEVVDGETFLNERLGIACYAWQFILRRDLIVSKENSNLPSEISNPKNILFKEKIYFEDTEWTPRILLRANRVASVDTIVYNYLWRKGSITLPTNPEKLHKVLVDKIALIEGFQWQRELAKNPQWFTWMTSVTTLSVLSILTAYPLREQRKYIAQLRAFGAFPLTTYHASGNMLHKTRLVNMSPLLFCWVLGKLSGAYWDNLVKHLYAALNVLRLWPHLLLFLFSPRRRMITRDMMAYRAEYGKGHLLWFLTYNKSFRGLFYYRIGNNLSMLIRWLAPTVHELTFSPQVQVGEGLLLFHAYCTILNARRIGDHCRILHMVTLGDKNGKVPTIGNHVEILPGATIVGGITIGDNCVIGPGAVVFKSVPANCVVVGNPAYILKRNGIVVNEKL